MTKAFPVTQRARDLVADILEMSPYGIVRVGAEQVRAGYNDGHAYVLLIARFEAETLERAALVADERITLLDDLGGANAGMRRREAILIRNAIRRLKGAAHD